MTLVPPPPKPAPPPPKPPGRLFQAVLFIAAVVWIALARWIAASSATGISDRLNQPAAEPTVEALFCIFLLLVGFSMLQVLGRQRSSVRTLLGLPKRPSATREWATGATIGWATSLGVVLVLALTRALHVQLAWHVRDLLLTLLSLVGLALLSFAEETAFRGYPFRLLQEFLGPSGATLLMAIVFGLFSAAHPFSAPRSVLITMLLGGVLCVGWLRTHGLWLSWGFNFAFKAATAVLFGLPVNGNTSFSYLVQTDTVGRIRWTGGNYGLTGSWICALALSVALAFVFRLTRDYAWNYTHRPIVAGGYAVDVAPPAAHVAMEAQAAPAGTTLVQILPIQPAPDLPAGTPIPSSEDEPV